MAQLKGGGAVIGIIIYLLMARPEGAFADVQHWVDFISYEIEKAIDPCVC